MRRKVEFPVMKREDKTVKIYQEYYGFCQKRVYLSLETVKTAAILANFGGGSWKLSFAPQTFSKLDEVKLETPQLYCLRRFLSPVFLHIRFFTFLV